MLVALCGPSGIGKGYIKNRLMADCPELIELPWLTTRPARANERLSGNRVFMTDARFDELCEAGDCLLVQELYGHRYGLERRHLAPQETKRLTEVHPENVPDALSIAPGLHLIGLVTSDHGLLAKRMSERNEEPSSLITRLAAAQRELSLIESYRGLFRQVFEVSEDTESTERVIRTLKTLINA